MATVIVGVDGSDGAQVALRFAVQEARLRGAVLRAVMAWDVDTLAYSSDVRQLTGIVLPAGHYDTLAGFVMTKLGRTPRVGDSVDALGHCFTVLEIDGRRAALVGVAPDGA